MVVRTEAEEGDEEGGEEAGCLTRVEVRESGGGKRRGSGG
jgi:hypothetical protein